MKKYIAKNICAAAAVALTLSSCGSNFLDEDPYQDMDIEQAIQKPADIQIALNGEYFVMGYYNLYGRTMVAMADVSSDVVDFTSTTNHFSSIFNYTYNENDAYLSGIWEDAYRVIDHSSRVILKANKMLKATPDDAVILDGLSQAHALRAMCTFAIANIYAPRYEAENENALGAVLVETPIGLTEQVSRATLKDTYAYILKELNKAEEYSASLKFTNAYMLNKAAIAALKARVYLYMGDFATAKTYAENAIAYRGGSLANTEKKYVDMYDDLAQSSEYIYTVAKSQDDYLSANSINTLYGNYGFSVAKRVQALYGEGDIRKGLASREGGKFSKAVSHVPVIRLSEMYLVMAECDAQGGSTAVAADTLFQVAKRNPAIASVADLPTDKAGLLAFIAEERQRELVQEGHRLFDVRRTKETIKVSGGTATLTDGNYLFPIPASEINTNQGVEQIPGWAAYRPK